MTIGNKLIRWIEGELTLTQGAKAGQSFTLEPWQRRFLRRAFSQPGEGALSVARGNGKTVLLAGVASACISGPLVEPHSESVIVASSFDQAMILFRHVLAFLQPFIDPDPRRYRIQDSTNRAAITDRTTGAMLSVRGSDPARLHGLAPKLILGDELAQWPANMIDRMLSALRTSLGKIPGSRAVWIGTRPASPDHPFARLLSGKDGYVQLHAAKPTDPPFRRSTWLKANPSLPTLPDLERTIRLEAAKAKREPSVLASFKALRLNQGVHEIERQHLIDPDLWESIEGEAPPDGPVVWGVDMGVTQEFSAVTAYWPDTGRLDSLAAFPSTPDLTERGLKDGVGPLYNRLYERGEIIVTDGRVTAVPELLREAMDRFGSPVAVASDRWRQGELLDALDLAGIPQGIYMARGMGFKDGAEDVRNFRRACLEGRVTPIVSLLLRAGMSEAVTVSDPAGNQKLAKGGEGGRNFHHRDDAVAAAILGVSLGSMKPDDNGEDDSDSGLVIIV